MSIFKKSSKLKVYSKVDEDGVTNLIYADVSNVGDPYEKEDLVVAFIIPSLDGQFHYSILHLWTRVSLKTNFVINCVSEDTYLNFCRNKLIDMANEIAVEKLNRWPDYYLFLDQDSVVHPELFEQLKAKNKDIVSAHYIRKQRWLPVWSPIPKLDKKEGGSIEQDIRKFKKGDLVEAITVGAGALLVKGEVIRKIKPPWFKVLSEKKTFFGEDAYFCQLCRENGYKVWVATDVPTGHYGATVFPSDWEQRGRKLRQGNLVWEI